MMDEQLIDEVAKHGVIFNRQKYYLNGSGGGTGGAGGNKYETKDEAWQTIAVTLRSDVETCKKRWKYLRERYVSQRKQGDPPVYEHLSRPYLEKMKFLDQHIQPRKSYRNVPNFLTSPQSANSSNYSEYNMDSKSNSSAKNIGHFGNTAQLPYHQQEQQHTIHALSQAAAAASALEVGTGQVKVEADQVFRDFAAAVASQQLQQISQSQMNQHQAAAVAAALADSSPDFQEHLGNGNGCIASSSSSMKSPLSSPITNGVHNGTSNSASTQQQAVANSSSNNVPLGTHPFNGNNGDILDSTVNGNFTMKRPRVQLSTQSQNGSNHNNNNGNHTNISQFNVDSEDDSDDNSTNMLHPQTLLNDQLENDHFNALSSTSTAAALQQRSNNNSNTGQQPCMFPSNADFLFQLYQQQTTTQQQQHFNKFPIPHIATQRSSELLVGELVTSELLKMSKERRKHAQKRILEILFFED